MSANRAGQRIGVHHRRGIWPNCIAAVELRLKTRLRRSPPMGNGGEFWAIAGVIFATKPSAS
jgi:hypothetical protein